MNEMLFLRRGQSEANAGHKGDWDFRTISLMETGKKQAKKVGKCYNQ